MSARPYDYSLLFMSLYDGSLYHFCKSSLALEEDIISVCLQSLIALSALRLKLKMSHFDAHIGNVLYKKTSDRRNWLIRWNRFDYEIPNTGYEIAITDFGLAGVMNDYVNLNFTVENLHLRHPGKSDDDILSMNRYNDCFRFVRSLHRYHKSAFTAQLKQLAVARFNNISTTTPEELGFFFEDVFNLPETRRVIQKHKSQIPLKRYSMDKRFDPKKVFPFLR